MSLIMKIVLIKPTQGVDIGLQKGSGSGYETVQKQRAKFEDLYFEAEIDVKKAKSGGYGFYGPFVQGPPDGRFLYLDIGTYAGQKDSVWGGRLKIPLTGIPETVVKESISIAEITMETIIPGVAKNGGPNCGTVKPFPGWHQVKKESK
jgi:hypothetical protein